MADCTYIFGSIQFMYSLAYQLLSNISTLQLKKGPYLAEVDMLSKMKYKVVALPLYAHKLSKQPAEFSFILTMATAIFQFIWGIIPSLQHLQI